MDRLGLLQTLITALDEGSLNRAAQRQGISQSAVSQQIRQLETHFGQQLLLRTATGVHATRAGATAAQHARQLLMGYAALEADLEQQSDRLSGTYRISVGTVLGRSVMGPLLLQMKHSYPELDIVMSMEDRIVDVVRENFDLALRAGTMGDSDGFCRKIAELETVLVAAPDYVRTHGTPTHPNDLQDLKFIRYNDESSDNLLRLSHKNLSLDVPVTAGFTSSDPQLTIQALKGGMGFARVVRIIADDHLTDGSLVQILPGYTPKPKYVYAVYPSPNGLDRSQQAIVDGFLAAIAGALSAKTTGQHLELITA